MPGLLGSTTPPNKARARPPPKGVVLEVEAAVLHHDVGLGLALVRGGGHRGRDLVVGVQVDDDAVLGQLLLDEDDLEKLPGRWQDSASASACRVSV